MSSLKQAVIDAVTRVTTDSKYQDRIYETPEAARDDFIKALISELFPESPEMPMNVTLPTLEDAMAKLTIAEPKPEPEAKPKKKPGPKPKAKPEVKPEPVAEAKPEPEVKPETEAESKKKGGRKPKAEPEVKPVAEDKPAPEAKPKKKSEPKPKPEGPVNIEKLNPTQTKKLKAASEELKVELDKKAFLAYLNGLTAEEFDAKKFDDHIKDFLASKTKPATANIMAVYTEFEGETYYVDLKTKRVYQQEGAVDVYVGDVGLAKFAEMEIPEDDEEEDE